ncbi:hypothetical protein SCP_0700610 [Sparassis crispa]|uniref:Protein YAE1 n=1 Tax=Sparassis crispa TaxID=139825 RepID=A0A401GRK7_9APHY|nr:hypothetical protein SCP_0700610 [Sparassis crispa]GBE84881.1 hypothetical protein SCP_0700610 [Sparassis crispa]
MNSDEMDDDNIWLDDPKALEDTEWSKLSSDFTNAGYREGITAGKESALQQGFDEGFAEVGAPLGRELGSLRGLASALLAFLTSNSQERPDDLTELQEMVSQLGSVRFSDIVPLDLEAERHAREHLDMDGEDEGELDLELNEELKDKRDIERLEDMMAQVSAGAARPTREDVQRLKEQLRNLCDELGIPVQWS